MGRAWRRTLSLLGMLGPAYGWLLFAVFAPLALMLVFSFMSDVPVGNRQAEATLEQYQAVFSRGFYWTLIGRSAKTAAYTTLFCLVLGYPLAYTLSRVIRGRWRVALFMLVIVPFWSNTLARLYAWVIILRRNGFVEQFFTALGLPEGTGAVLYSYPAVLIALVHAYLPFMVLSLYVALDRISPSLLEASAGLGASPARTFFKITLPLSMSGILTGTILVFIPVLGSFVEPRLLGGRSGVLIGNVIEDQFVQVFNWPLGSALAFILLALVLLLMGLMVLLLRRMPGGSSAFIQ